MDADDIDAAVVAAIKGSAIPRIDKEKVSAIFGSDQGEVLAGRVSELAQEAVRMPIEGLI
jgi:hypothetical protein